jgi:hypothetical protein
LSDAQSISASLPANIDHPLSNIPPPVDGYKRSLDLLHQISRVVALQSRNADYVLFADNAREMTICIPHPDIKLTFRQYREKAMTLGDRESVAILGQLLTQRADEVRMTHNQIVAQLRKEYGFDVGHAIQELNARNVGRLELTKHFEGYW